ncbi:MAG: hypothetical protein KGI37_10435 [Alphaproteobacteria bacterium]|nr:hypothetical protein [Alphaproteobacteria bacterium]
MDIERLVIANPSGNITAIVFDETPRSDMRDIGAKIQSTYPSVEQVLFVERQGNHIHGQMAGGEFCGNAARALGWVMTKRKDGPQTFTMSGSSSPITVDAAGNIAKLSMRMPLTTEQVIFEDHPVQIVHLEGISHAIMTPEHPMFNFLSRCAAKPDRWQMVTHVLEDLGIHERSASGLIFMEADERGISITPYVYVKAINTLYPEMACASGSIAAAYVMANDDTPSVLVRQPSEEILAVSINPIGKTSKIIVSGNMDVIWDGPAADLEYSAAALSGRHMGVLKTSPLPHARFG